MMNPRILRERPANIHVVPENKYLVTKRYQLIPWKGQWIKDSSVSVVNLFPPSERGNPEECQVILAACYIH